ncbi:hypothetical protein AVEN_253912-1 [Araneus ventricosus]|uniref:RNase H type-1 domain-containing protein n=1 Tax=Araneus ventricosus TaxID=182803 RepID=A0A4Y2EKJ9_ARAVE|nr:hypothetical protein AVEN_253912-1 [Araneus ventricosus]
MTNWCCRSIEIIELWDREQIPRRLIHAKSECWSDMTFQSPYLYFSSMPWRTFNETNYVGINVFTDGSKINNKVGCAMVVSEDGNEKEHEIWRLNSETTVFIAEMVSIRESVNYCKRRQIDKPILFRIQDQP